jgi:hypothetical protein
MLWGRGGWLEKEPKKLCKLFQSLGNKAVNCFSKRAFFSLEIY